MTRYFKKIVYLFFMMMFLFCFFMANVILAEIRDEVLKEEKASRVQLLAYAQAPSGNESRARRLSLARALSVRSYLVKKGLTTTRMDVRALGSRAKKGPIDRVDVMLVPQ